MRQKIYDEYRNIQESPEREQLYRSLQNIVSTVQEALHTQRFMKLLREQDLRTRSKASNRGQRSHTLRSSATQGSMKLKRRKTALDPFVLPEHPRIQRCVCVRETRPSGNPEPSYPTQNPRFRLRMMDLRARSDTSMRGTLSHANKITSQAAEALIGEGWSDY